MIGHFYGRQGGCSSDSLRYHRKHSATGVLLHLSRDRGGYFGRVTKKESPNNNPGEWILSRDLGLDLRLVHPGGTGQEGNIGGREA